MNYLKTLVVSLIAAPTVALAANGPPIVPAPQTSCSDIQWSPAFLKEYPKAPAACRAIIVKDGVKFATFNGKVSKVGHNYVQVAITDVAGYPISTIAFQIGAGGAVTVNNEVEKVSELKVDDQLTFWVREGAFGISPTLTDKPMRIVMPEAGPTT
jgi:hypothetical protein